jgi:hypothetical protein
MVGEPEQFAHPLLGATHAEGTSAWLHPLFTSGNKGVRESLRLCGLKKGSSIGIESMFLISVNFDRQNQIK